MAYEMSAQQLDELWKYEGFLAHHLLDLPIRTCSAVPNDSWGKAMPPDEFVRLKTEVRKLWCRAAQELVAFKCEGNAGWGLRVRRDIGKKWSVSANSFTALGWLVKAPSPQECPTGHRYLRSPVVDDTYLGGPISLAQFSNSPTVRCQRSISNGSLKFRVVVSTIKALDEMTELTWPYSFGRMSEVDATKLNLHPKEDWQLKTCCQELEEKMIKLEMSNKVKRPTKAMQLVTSFMWCTFCGKNLDSQSSRVNRKEHFATHHAVEICNFKNLRVDAVDPEEGVIPKDFKTSLEIIDSVLQSLRAYGYTVIPASHFLSNADIPDFLSTPEIYQSFKTEAEEAYRKYKVILLKGISLPDSYEDLLPADETSYKDVVWFKNIRPPSNTFSVKKDLTQEEKDNLDRDIMTEFQNIIVSYANI